MLRSLFFECLPPSDLEPTFSESSVSEHAKGDEHALRFAAIWRADGAADEKSAAPPSTASTSATGASLERRGARAAWSGAVSPFSRSIFLRRARLLN